jgi:colicin import membrane protein
MPSQAERIDFAPPLPQGTGRAFVFAMVAHLLLVAALTWGVSWKREATPAAVEAELWSSLPQQAAPRLQEVVPPQPQPQTQPQPKPQPVVKEEPAPAKAPDIAVEKEKPKPKPPEPKPEAKPEPKPEPKPESKPQAKPEPKVDKAAQERKLAEEREAERLKNLERVAGLAGASGAPSSPGTAPQSSGPSSGYSGLIKGRVKPNLVFTDTVSGNPKVTIEVRMAPDGTIIGRPRVTQSSGNREWDEAVVRAFEKTEVLPRDNGRVWSPLIIEWRVND